MVSEAEQFAEEDKKRRGAAEAKNNAESLIHTTEKQLQEFGDKVAPDVKTEIETALAEAKTAVESNDPDQMTEKTNALTQAAMKLGQAMYQQQQAETEAAAGPDAGTSGPGTSSRRKRSSMPNFRKSMSENKGS